MLSMKIDAAAIPSLSPGTVSLSGPKKFAACTGGIA
jgi:hypothetical protein